MSVAVELILKCIDPYNVRAVDLAPAVEELRSEGVNGSNRLAHLLRQLVDSRSEGTVYALQVATKLDLSPPLAGMLSAILRERPIKHGSPGRFDPEISGESSIGWTDRTFAQIQQLAQQALENPSFPASAVAAAPAPAAPAVARPIVVPASGDRGTAVDKKRARRALKVQAGILGFLAIVVLTLLTVIKIAGHRQPEPDVGNLATKISIDFNGHSSVTTLVAPGFFERFAPPAVLGRYFVSTDHTNAAPEVAVISHDLWAAEFGSRLDIVGSTALLSDKPIMIVGVAPEGFDVPYHSDLWIPGPPLRKDITR